VEPHRAGVEPHARHPFLLAHGERVGGAAHHHHQIKLAVAQAGGAVDRPEQHDVRAREGVFDIHPALRQVCDEAPRGALLRRGRAGQGGGEAAERARQKQEKGRQPPRRRTPSTTVNSSLGRIISSTASRAETRNTSSPSATRSFSPPSFCANCAPSCAPTVPPTSSRMASRMSTLWVFMACSTVTAAEMKMI